MRDLAVRSVELDQRGDRMELRIPAVSGADKPV
jgi:hypothetical protein